MDSQRGIGRDGGMPWQLPVDLKYFARITKGPQSNDPNAVANTVIMGRKTWESIPARFRPLQGRTNIVISHQRDFSAAGCSHATSFEQALEMADPRSTCFVIGGAMIYALALQHPDCEQLLITEIDAEFDCQVFFPPLDAFERVEKGSIQHDNGLDLRFCRWRRRPGAS